MPDTKYLSKVKISEQEYSLKDLEARAAIAELEQSKQDVIDADNKLAAAYVSLTKPSDTKLTSTDVQAAVYELEAAIDAGGTGSVVTVEKQATAESGYFATYVIKQGGEAVTGAKINIPRDYLVKSAEIKTVTVVDQPYTGAKVGDKYIDFVVNVKEGTEDVSHIYLPVNELVDAYLADETTLHMENNTFSVKAVPMDKVTGLQDALDLKADEADVEAALALKEDKSALKDLAYVDYAVGTVPAQSITGVKATGNIQGTASVDITTTATAADLTTTKYTPSGSITGDAIKDGAITVTVKDATTQSEADLSYSAYTPTGSVSFTKNNDGSFQVSGTIDKPEITVDDSATDTFVKSLKAGTTDAAAFTEGAFTPASISEGFFNAGTQASYSHSGFNGGAFTKGTAVEAAIEGVVATVGTGTDAETLIFTAAQKNEVMDYDAEFTAATYGTDTFTANTLPSIDTTKFDGGSKAADTFTSNKLPVVDGTATAVTAVTAELAANPVFTGDKFNPAFTGTEVAQMKVTSAKYYKQEIDDATFTGTATTLGFSGTESSIDFVTDVEYDKVDTTATGTISAQNVSLDVGTIAVTAQNVIVSPEAE